MRIRRFRVVFWWLWAVAVLPGVLRAQDPATPPPADEEVLGETTLTVIRIVQETGWMAYPLALLSLVAVFLIIYYLLTIRQGAVVSDRFMSSADVLLRKGDYRNLLEICQHRTDAISAVTEKALDHAMRNPEAVFEEVKEVAEAEGIRQANALNQRIAYLADVGAIAPMVGLLGTVLGMIRAFRSIAVHVVDQDKKLELASGVSEALFTTAGGLAIGIPALIFYSLFRGKVNRLISDLEAASTHVLTLIGSRMLKRPASARHPDGPGAGGMENYYSSPYPVTPAPRRR